VGDVMMHDRHLTVAMGGMIMCMVLLFGVIVVRIAAPSERSSPIAADSMVTADITVEMLRGSLR
jgi:hypothetical protein